MATENTTKYAYSWNGIPARGFADGDAVVVEYDNDEVTAYSGTKGEGLLVVGKDGRGKITVKLTAASPSVKLFRELDRQVKRGDIAVAPPFIFKKIVDGIPYVFTGNCLLSKMAPITASREATEIELVFITANMVDG